MNDNLSSTYQERLEQLLSPHDDAERATIAYLASTTPRQGAVFIELLTRAISTARAEGFDTGYSEGTEYAGKAARLTGQADDLDVIQAPGQFPHYLLDDDTD